MALGTERAAKPYARNGMALGTERLSVTEKVGYGLGDAAANFIWQTMITFQLAFYTDAFGITAAAAGTLFLVVRVFDAAFDPFMGVVADRTNTRWGKFRPWILWTAVPFGVIAFLAFTTPDLSPSGKLAYAYVTYILLMMVYSANNLPYSALSGVMTGDAVERTSLSSYRMLFAMLAQFVVQVLALPMVARFGHGNDALGYKVTIGIFSALAVVFFVITFATTRERVRPDPKQKSSIRQDFADLLGERTLEGDVRTHGGPLHHARAARRRDGVLLQVLREARGRFQLVQRHRHRRDDHRPAALEADRRADRQAPAVHVRPDRDGRVHRGVHPAAAEQPAAHHHHARRCASSPTDSPSRCSGR